MSYARPHFDLEFHACPAVAQYRRDWWVCDWRSATECVKKWTKYQG